MQAGNHALVQLMPKLQQAKLPCDARLMAPMACRTKPVTTAAQLPATAGGSEAVSAAPPATLWAPEDAKGLVMAGCGCTALPCPLVVAVSAGVCRERGCSQLLERCAQEGCAAFPHW